MKNLEITTQQVKGLIYIVKEGSKRRNIGTLQDMEKQNKSLINWVMNLRENNPQISEALVNQREYMIKEDLASNPNEDYVKMLVRQFNIYEALPSRILQILEKAYESIGEGNYNPSEDEARSIWGILRYRENSGKL